MARKCCLEKAQSLVGDPVLMPQQASTLLYLNIYLPIYLPVSEEQPGLTGTFGTRLAEGAPYKTIIALHFLYPTAGGGRRS